MDSKFITGLMGLIIAVILIMVFFEKYDTDTKPIKKKIDYPEEIQGVEPGDLLIVDSVTNYKIYLSFKKPDKYVNETNNQSRTF